MKDTWISHLPDQEEVGITRLFCLPYAGGSASVFRDWQRLLPRHINVTPIELPGHGSRLVEMPYRDIREMVPPLVEAISSGLSQPFAFFGHCMGALIALEACRLIEMHFSRKPECLIVSGHRAPHLPSIRPSLYALPIPEFIQALLELEGSPNHMLKNPELRELMLPALRADFQLSDTYVCDAARPVTCPMLAIAGIDDLWVGSDGLAAWSELTTGPFKNILLPGGHFYLNTSQPALLQTIMTALPKSATR